jgi:hypothetical protein
VRTELRSDCDSLPAPRAPKVDRARGAANLALGAALVGGPQAMRPVPDCCHVSSSRNGIPRTSEDGPGPPARGTRAAEVAPDPPAAAASPGPDVRAKKSFGHRPSPPDDRGPRRLCPYGALMPEGHNRYRSLAEIPPSTAAEAPQRRVEIGRARREVARMGCCSPRTKVSIAPS